MKHTFKIENLKIKIVMQWQDVNHKQLCPSVQAIGAATIQFKNNVDYNLLKLLDSFQVYLNVLGRWNKYQLLVINNSKEPQSSKIYSFKVEENEDQFRRDLLLARA